MPPYHISQDAPASQLKPDSFKNERELQRLFENNLEILMGVRFIASEFTTGDRQRGPGSSISLKPRPSAQAKNL